MWKHACAYSKWTPTNQFLHSVKDKQKDYNWKDMDLSRFGFIGSNKQCYWGLIAVLWQKPLPVAQEINNLKATHGVLHGGKYDHYGTYGGFGPAVKNV
jgi:hypothetical protein